MKGVILAGGRGARLNPITTHIPKPLVPILNRPVMEYCIEWLKKHGIKEIAITVHYLSEKIRSYFGDGKKLGVNLVYFDELEPLGTAGGIRNIVDFFEETFIVVSADIVTDFQLDAAISYHKEKGSLFTMVTTKIEVLGEYGIVVNHKNGKVKKFTEKPPTINMTSDQVNTGIYIVHPEILKLIPNNISFDFSHDLFPLLLQKELSLYSYELKGYWMDIGHLNTFRQSQKDFIDKELYVPTSQFKVRENVWVGANTLIDQSVVIKGPVWIGEGCRIEEGVKLGPYTVIGNRTVVKKYSQINYSTIMDDVNIGIRSVLIGTTISSNCTINDNCTLQDSSVIGHYTNIGSRSVIGSGVKVNSDSMLPESSIFRTLKFKLDKTQSKGHQLVGIINKHSEGVNDENK